MRHPLALRATAYHEAGHAAAAWALGWPIVLATIEPGDGYAGMVRVGRHPSPKALLEHHEEGAVIDMAGPAAQAIYAPRSAVRHGASCDLAVIDVRADLIFYKRDGHYPGDDRKRPFVRLIRRHARELVRRHWFAVHQVALALLKHGSLSGITIARHCQEADAEWAQLAAYPETGAAVDYVRRQVRDARPLPPLRRSTVAAATLRAVLAGSSDIAGAVRTSLVARGYSLETCRAAWLAAQEKEAA